MCLEMYDDSFLKIREVEGGAARKERWGQQERGEGCSCYLFVGVVREK